MNFRKIRFIFLLIVIVFVIFQIFHPSSFIKTFLGTSNVIVIDPGHGGKDPGAIGINDSYEKDISLDISKKLYKKLKRLDYKVIMTRDTDEYIDNIVRANIANKEKAKVFISIHCNSLENDNVTNGVQVLYYPNRKSNSNNPDNETLAQIILDKILKNTGANNKGIVEREDLIVLNQTEMPAIIIECGFLCNEKEANLLKTNKYQNKIVDAVIDGLKDYFNH